MKDKIIEAIRKEESLLKFAYIGKGRERFIRAIKSKEYTTFRNEKEIIVKNIDVISKFLGEKVIELGCGDEMKSYKLFIKKEVTCIDISKDALIEFSKKLLGKVKKLTLINSDFCKFNFSNLKGSSLLLGNTLGNMLNMKQFLKKLKGVGNLVLGMEVFNGDIESIVREYDNVEGFRFIFTPLEALGVEFDERRFKVIFNKKKRRIEEYFLLPKRIFGKKKILLSISYKLTEEELLSLIDKFFSIEKVFKKGRNRIILCKV